VRAREAGARAAKEASAGGTAAAELTAARAEVSSLQSELSAARTLQQGLLKELGVLSSRCVVCAHGVFSAPGVSTSNDAWCTSHQQLIALKARKSFTLCHATSLPAFRAWQLGRGVEAGIRNVARIRLHWQVASGWW
jgi:hypothetical protein